MNGIMDGIKDRQDYNVGGGAGMAAENIRLSDLPFMKREMPSVPDEVRSVPSIRNDSEPSYEETVRKIMEDYKSKEVNPVYKLLMQGGLKGMYERGGGSVAANLAKAFEGPTDQLFKDLDAKRAMERDIELKIADVAEQKNRRLQEQGFELDKLTLQQDIKAGKYDKDIEFLMQGKNEDGTPITKPQAVQLIIDRYHRQYSMDKSPGYYERETKKSRMNSYIDIIRNAQGNKILTDDTAMELIDAVDSLPQEFKKDLDKSKYIIDQDSEITMNEDGSFQLSKLDAGEYVDNRIYFDIFNTGKFYRKQGNRLIPLATG